MAKIKKHELSFGGKMELVEIEVDDLPKEILKADDWFGPQVGELCFINGKIDVVKTLSWGDTHGGIFKPHMMVTFENCDTKINYSAVTRIEVKKGKVFSQKNINNILNLHLMEFHGILQEEFSPKGKIQGLTIIELANLMKELGCHYALNLDGGGSSTLWIEGEIVNLIFGDIDESNGEKVVRPVSDAIVFMSNDECGIS